ncbi:MAG TPA: hypothetical protein VK171_16695 [Fimbriimonas sp.]|nr:hypothetical protein [Fimbriimonas sp.]
MKLTTLHFSIKPEQVKWLTMRLTAPSYITLAVFFAFVSWFAASVYIQAFSGTLFFSILGVCLFYAVVFVFIVAGPRTLLKVAPRSFRSKRFMKFDADGFDSKYESGTYSRIVWADVDRALHLSGMTYLFGGSSQYFTVPDTAWQTPMERDEFHAFLRSRKLLK